MLTMASWIFFWRNWELLWGLGMSSSIGSNDCSSLQIYVGQLLCASSNMHFQAPWKKLRSSTAGWGFDSLTALPFAKWCVGHGFGARGMNQTLPNINRGTSHSHWCLMVPSKPGWTKLSSMDNRWLMMRSASRCTPSKLRCIPGDETGRAPIPGLWTIELPWLGSSWSLPYRAMVSHFQPSSSTRDWCRFCNAHWQPLAVNLVGSEGSDTWSPHIPLWSSQASPFG